MAVVIDTEVQDPGSIVMADDGKGSQVNIPTVLISREDGQLILEYLSQGEIVLSVSFQVEIRQTSDLQLWIDITDHKNFVFLRGLQPFFQKIQNHGILQTIQSFQTSGMLLENVPMNVRKAIVFMGESIA